LIFILIGVAAWYWYMGNKGYVSTDDAFIDADKATISSKILGRIVSLKAAEGDTVKAGQVLIRLDTLDLKAQEKQFIAATLSATESISLAKVNLDKGLNLLIVTARGKVKIISPKKAVWKITIFFASSIRNIISPLPEFR